MRRKLITAAVAADLLALAESTFRQKCREMGLHPVDLNAALPRGTKPIRDHWRWIEDEVMAFIEKAIKNRDKDVAELKAIFRFERTRK